jgi:hypothetical protein
MAGEQQTAVEVLVIPCDGAFATTPTLKEVCLLAVPDGVNYQLALLSVSIVAQTIPIDGDNALTIDIEWCDDSASDAVADLKSTFDALTGITALVNNQIWRGVQILDPGDTVNAEFTSTTPTTASKGAAFIVEYRVLQRS